MFWRGGMSPVGYWNRDGWYGRGPMMAQGDLDCTGDVCVPIASRLAPESAKQAFEKMKYAISNKAECLSKAGSESTKDELAAKLERAALGITDEAGLTRAQADYLSKLEACVGSIPNSTATVTPVGTPQGAPDFTLPAVVAAGALGIAALVTVLSGTKA